MFAWITAALLSASVLISLVVVVGDRNNLRDQLDEQDLVVACRSDAEARVDRAMADRQILLGEESLAVSEIVIALVDDDPDNPTDLSMLAEEVRRANDALVASRIELQAALDAQQESITSCRISD